MKQRAKLCHFFITLGILVNSFGITMAQSSISSDEKVIFFPTSSYLSPDGETWNIPIHGWIFEPSSSLFRRKAIETALNSKYGLKTSKNNAALFSERIQFLLADNERNKKLTISLAGKTYSLPASAKNGHFQKTLKLPVASLSDQLKRGVFTFTTVPSKIGEKSYRGLSLPVSSNGITVISDIDDTVKVSSVVNRKELLDNTFYKPFQAVSGMSQFYQSLKDMYGAHFHYVSSSPWHLYEPLYEFFTLHKFPTAEFTLKDFRFKDKSLLNLFKKGTETKPALIRDIIARFPNRKFILVGDSGEEDPEVYAKIMEEFPEKIVLCLIRNVTGASMQDKRFHSFSDKKVYLFDSADSLLTVTKKALQTEGD